MSLSVPVFISSKQSELAVERDLLAEHVRRVPPLDPIMAEEWAPQARRVQSVMLDKVRLAPIYVGLFASVYSEPTELEYREATKNPYRELLIYVKAGAERDPRLATLVEAMRDDHVITTFVDVRDLLRRFSDHLREAVSRMVLMLQKIGEAPPVSRGSASHLAARWQRQQAFLGDFAVARMAATERAAIIDQLNAQIGKQGTEMSS